MRLFFDGQIFFLTNSRPYSQMGGGLLQLVAYGAQDVYLRL